MRWRKAHPELESTGALATAAADVATMPGHAQRPVEDASTERVSIEYRAEIDGLRALSVIAVILFHAGVPGFSGGYVGVDVFFVISGYLITALLSANTSPSLSRQLASFYVRRARRILPALLFVLVVCTVIALLLLLPDHLVRFGRSLALSSALLANLSAWQEGGYFGLQAQFAPLRHLWSIAVEEQFYIAYPLVLLLLARYLPRFKVAAIATLAVTSFVICVWGSFDFASANYYFTPSRGWQLLLGALLALNGAQWKQPRVVNELLAVVAVLALASAVHYLDSTSRYPGMLALIPSVATAVLIACARGNSTFIGRLLALRPLVFTGLISYSLYLWHAPALAFFEYFNITAPSAAERGAVILAIYALAAATWWSIETPVRSKARLRSTSQFALVALATSVALVAGGTLLWRSDGVPQRFSPEVRTVLNERGTFDAGEQQCFNRLLERVAAGDLCSYVPAGRPAARVLVWGDSHALALLPAYHELGRARNLEIYFAISPACRPLLEVTAPRLNEHQRDRCAKFNAAMLQAVDVLQPALVILNAYWTYPDMTLVPSERLEIASGDSTFGLGLTETLRRIGAPARKVCAVLDVPTYERSVPFALAMTRHRGIGEDFMRISAAEAREQQWPAERDIRRLERSGLLRIADPKDALCGSGTCLTLHDGIPMYRDEHHLSVAGARFVAQTLNDCFEASVP